MNTSDRAQIARTLTLLHLPESLIELRMLSEKGTHSGYYPDRDRLIDDAARSSGKWNCYITLNPVHLDCAARVSNRFVFARRGTTTKDSEVLRRTGLLVDFDPKRLTGIATTDAEHEAGLERAREVRQWLREQKWGEPLFASSGNGAALFYRLDLPSNDGGLVKKVLETLARRFSNSAVELDTSVHNASRIVRLIGTMNCKGESTSERPHRLSRIIEAPDKLEVVTREQLELLVSSAPSATASPCNLNLLSPDDRLDIAGWLTTCGVAFTTEQANDGIRFRLLACPKKGSGHEDGRTWITQRNDGSISAGCFHAKCKDLNWKQLRKLIDPGFDSDAERAITGGSLESPTNCHRFARVHLNDTQHDDGSETYGLEGDTLYRWCDVSWQPISEPDFARRLTRGVKAEADRLARAARNRGLESYAPNVTTAFVGNVRNALLSMLSQAEGQPAWLGGNHHWAADEVLACSDGLVHLPSFAAGKDDYRMPLTPRFFSTLNLGYDFDPAGPQPTQWLEFLNQLWPNDAASIALLQEWLGYLLTLDTSLQKMLIMFGPGGGGKGTLLEVARRLIGPQNVTSLTLPSLSESHALQALVGKSLCIFPDASIPERMDKTPLVETIKSITGEDLISINPKHKPRYSVKLNTRLMVATNDMLDLPDASGALSRRLLVLRFTQSFTKSPDTKLREKLIGELPGILLWAIAGWKRLREQGRFTEPESGQEVKSNLDESSSPVIAFTTECCLLAPTAMASKDELYAAWKSWCHLNGREPGSKESFARLLFSAVKDLTSHRPRVDGGRLSCYKGIALREDSPVVEAETDLSPAIRSEEEAREYAESVARSMQPSHN